MISRTRKSFGTLLFSLITLTCFSQEFNDSIMNHVLFDELVAHVTRNNSNVNLYYSNVASDLKTKPAVEYMKTHGCTHRPDHAYLKSLPKEERDPILKDFGINNVDEYRLGDGEILVRVFISTTITTTYQDVAKQSIEAWLKSPDHAPTINNLSSSSDTYIIAISSSYNKQTNSIDIALSDFEIYCP